ncbi:hypothetical protein GWQ44_04665 [Pseudomonas sp. 3MA1]|uniref:hypothetical protein n=1 Tax=Pseudomonas sp. 3MA1 TaxID=2699196 RepID=UPI0023DDE5C7|nr:hypothetical protein [Pseudomonas sp. 3MA1]MDF2394817.1 hypothetical protein [Pseudomonas sp. 3MA1]
MFDTHSVTDKEIEQLRIGKLPVTTAGLIYKSFFSQDEHSARQLLRHAFEYLFTIDKKGNPHNETVYRFEVESRNEEDPRGLDVSIYNTEKNVALHHVVIDRRGLDLLAGA